MGRTKVVLEQRRAVRQTTRRRRRRRAGAPQLPQHVAVHTHLGLG